MILIKTQRISLSKNRIFNYLLLGIATLFILGLTSCYTIVQTVEVQTIQDADIAKLESLEISLIDYRLSDKGSLEKIESLIKKLEKKDTVNKPFKAKLLALKIETLILKDHEKKNPNTLGFKKRITEMLKQVELYNPREERVFIIRALMSTSQYTKKDYLTRGSGRPNASRCFMELGLISFEIGEYRDAVAYLDQASMKLPTSYEKFYIKTRDKAFRLAKGESNGKSGESPELLLVKDKLTLEECITLLKTKSSLLKGVSGGTHINKIIESLKKNAFISNNKIQRDDLLPRRELANILAWLIAKKENDLNLLAESGNYYKDKKTGSPIGDIPIKNRFFNPAVVVLEAEVMDLPDGENFFPKRAVSGSDMEKCLKRLRRSYK